MRPRVYIAFAFSTVLGALLVIDAVRTDYAMSELTLTVLVGTIATLLGVEVADILRRK